MATFLNFYKNNLFNINKVLKILIEYNLMGNSQSIQKISYEDVQFVIKNQGHVLINTLSEKEQECLIPNTVNIYKEEIIINKFLLTGNKNVKIITVKTPY